MLKEEISSLKKSKLRFLIIVIFICRHVIGAF